MSGKLKATLLGAIFGAVVAVIVEVFAVVVNDETFFGTQRSWLTLAAVVVIFAWLQARAYNQRQSKQHDRTPQQDSSDKWPS